MDVGEFHWTNGWYFKRNDDGSVRVRKCESAMIDAPVSFELTIPPFEWVSLVAHLAPGGEPANYEKAKVLHLPTATIFCQRCTFAMALHPTPPEAGGCPGYP